MAPPAVDAAHDAGRVAAVVGAAVDGQRHVDRVTGLEGDPVGPFRVDRGVEVEGVGVVAAPFLVGADDLDETGAGGVGPDVHVGCHLQYGEEPFVCFEQAVAVVVGGELLDQPLVSGTHLRQQLGECLLRLRRHRPPGFSPWGPIIGRTLVVALRSGDGRVRRAGRATLESGAHRGDLLIARGRPSAVC